jgi:hypothetical protein
MTTKGDLMRSTLNNEGQPSIDYEKLSDAELYALLTERAPAVAETVREVKDSNREKLIAFLKFLSSESG